MVVTFIEQDRNDITFDWSGDVPLVPLPVVDLFVQMDFLTKMKLEQSQPHCCGTIAIIIV